jgi:HEAT repeat protein
MAEGSVKETLSQLLCSAGRPARDDRDNDPEKVGVADGPRASAHAKALLKAALDPLLTALKRKEGPRAWAASLAVIDMPFEERCANRQAVFRMTGDAIVALIHVQTTEQKGDFLLGLSALGPAARSAVPIALPLLDDPRFKAQAIQLLGAIGPASAPAVPKLRSLLDGDQRVAAALALGEIGPPARAALPDLISVLAESDRRGCQKTGPLRALAVPVGLLGATGESEASQAVGALLSSLRACPQNAEAIITALGSVGPRGRPAEPALLAVMRDGASRLDLRLLASQSLREIGAPLSADDQALVRSLEAELRRRKTPRPFVGNQLGKQL